MDQSNSKIFDIIVVGSGLSGVWSSFGLKDKDVLMLDSGFDTSDFFPKDLTILDVKNKPEKYSELLLGKKFESLNNIFKSYLSPKIKAPLLAPSAKSYGLQNFEYIYSEHQGGLANNWGAGIYPFNDHDLSDYLFNYEEIKPFYNEISNEIGICGEHDDLVKIYGDDLKLQKALPLSQVLNSMHTEYFKKKKLLNEEGFYLGKGRMAVATEGGKTPKYGNNFLEFFYPNNPAVYNPRQTLEILKKRQNFSYKGKLKVLRVEEKENFTEVYTQDSSGEINVFKAKKVLLGAGAIQSTKILVNSFKKFGEKFPLLDNCTFMIPIYNLKLLGTPFSKGQNIGGLLNGYYNYSDKNYLHFSIYSMGQVLLSDIITKIPLPFGLQMKLGKILLNTVSVVQVFFPDKQVAENYISFSEDGSIKIEYKKTPFEKHTEKKLLKFTKKLGMFGLPFQIERLKPGSGIHYAGMIPMKKSGENFSSCDSFGKVRGTSNLYIVDAASFPSLPAKNHSFTIMANALRIGRHINNLQF